MGNLKLTSSAFSDGGEIPREYGYKNGNKVPPLTVSGSPEVPESLALIMDDPDAMGAVGKVWVHWVVWNLTWFADGKPDFSRPTKQGMTDFGEVGYGGPAPPDKRHTYVFKLYALDIELDLPNELQRLTLKKQWKVTYWIRQHLQAHTRLENLVWFV